MKIKECDSPVINEKEIKTYFASYERSSPENIREEADFVINNPIINVVLQAVEGFVLILNENRQILAGNREILDYLGVNEMDHIISFRPGEIFSCKYASQLAGGCGTTRYCRHCGAVIAMLSSQNTGKSEKNECHVMILRNNKIECIDFLVHVTPLKLKGHKLLVFVLQDISSIKRREVLEKVFLHDINNILGGIVGWSEILREYIEDSKEAKIAGRIIELTSHLKHEFDYQHTIYLAEKGELTIKKEYIQLKHILSRLKAFATCDKLKKDKNIIFYGFEEDMSVNTDCILLIRVLINMIKNALEATEKNGTVDIVFQKHDRNLIFSVHNKGVIPEDVSLNIFKRSFSTKEGTGRGIGTYSMKLLGENYLGGTVTFSSGKEENTVFSISLPCE